MANRSSGERLRAAVIGVAGIGRTHLQAYRALGELPEFKQLLQEWSQYVAEAVMIHGDVIE